MDEIDLAAALGEWDLGGAFTLRPTPHGVSRFTRFVDAPRASYVACAYLPGTSEDRVRYEHRLLTELGEAGLPFAVPLPVTTADGETVVEATGRDGQRLVALYTVVPGGSLDGRSVDQTRAFGAAVGELHRALEVIDPGPAPAWDRIYGAMERVLAGDSQMLELATTAPLERERSQRLVGILDRLMDEGPTVTAALPKQLRHGDCHRGNAMVIGERISGILDFEVAGPGTRAMDLAHGAYYLWAWCDPPEAAWDHLAAFAGGYARVIEPDPAQVAAVPTMARLYFAASIPPLVARWKEGTVTAERVRLRAELALKVDEFFKRNGKRVLRLLATGS